MRIEKSGDNTFLIVPTKKFSFFMFLGSCIYIDGTYKFNGDDVHIIVGSQEEYIDLFKLFRDHKFRVFPGGNRLDGKKHEVEKRVYHDPELFIRSGNRLTFGRTFLSLGVNGFGVEVFSKEEKERFVSFLSILSRDYNYKTQYNFRGNYFKEVIR